MRVKSFDQFILEAKDVIKDKKPKHLEDIKYKDDSDKELEDEVNTYMDKKSETCPRCGKTIDDCECETDDPWSTQNYHRVPKGKEEKSKPKQEFKK